KTLIFGNFCIWNQCRSPAVLFSLRSTRAGARVDRDDESFLTGGLGAGCSRKTRFEHFLQALDPTLRLRRLCRQFFEIDQELVVTRFFSKPGKIMTELGKEEVEFTVTFEEETFMQRAFEDHGGCHVPIRKNLPGIGVLLAAKRVHYGL